MFQRSLFSNLSLTSNHFLAGVMKNRDHENVLETVLHLEISTPSMISSGWLWLRVAMASALAFTGEGDSSCAGFL